MDGAAFVKGFKNISNGVKRTAERASVEVRKAVGLTNLTLPNKYPQYDNLSTEFKYQTRNLDSLHNDAVTAYEAIQRTTGTACSLAAKLRDSLSTHPSHPSYIAAEALYNAHATVVDDVLPRVERRVKKRVIDPTKEELAKARQVALHMEDRKRCLLDAARYHERVADNSSASHEDIRKTDDKLAELDRRTNELISVMSESIKRRAALIDRLVAETIEFQRRFYVDSSRAMERAVEAVGASKLAAIRGSAEDLVDRTNETSVTDDNTMSSSQLPPRSSPPAATPEVSLKEKSSIWNELDDDDEEDHTLPHHSGNLFDSPASSNHKTDPISSSSGASRESQGDSSYPSSGVGHREVAGGYASLGRKESIRPQSSKGSENHDASSSYPTGGSRHREKSYPNARNRAGTKPPPAPTVTSSNPFAPSSSRESEKAKRGNDGEVDLLGIDDPQPALRQSRSARAPSPPSASVEDLLGLGGGSSRSMGSSSSTSAMEGDLLGDLAGMTSSGGKGRSSSRSRKARSPMTSFSAPTMGVSVGGSSGVLSRSKTPSGNSSSASDLTETLEREALRKKHALEIKARADEKLAAVREREQADTKEREQKDNSRSTAERKIDQWTGNGTRRGNLRALLASLDTVLYSGATWKPVTMDTLKQNSKVKVNYHKAILQVHPDKINSKNLPPEQQVLAELVFDELKNGYEVWTAECEGRPPPAGSVGPKGGANSRSGFGMGGMRNMYNNNVGGMGGMGGMGRNSMGRGSFGGMGGMGGMGRMGGMNGGVGVGGMSGMGGMGGMGRGGMGAYGAPGWGPGMGTSMGMGGDGRRGTGMANPPQGYGRGMNNKQ